MLLYARFNRIFLLCCYRKYALRVHDVIPVKDLVDNRDLPTTPCSLLTGLKPNVKQFRVFGCPAVFKKYEFSDKGERTKDKFLQQGIRGIFVGLPDDSASYSMFLMPREYLYPWMLFLMKILYLH